MSDKLTQEELDALLRAGLGAQEEEEEGEGPVFKETASARAQKATIEHDFGAKARERKPRSKMRRSPMLDEQVAVQKAVFEDFEPTEYPADTTNLEIILNLNLEIRVELGKAKSTVKEVLEMGPGSVIELNKLNGEPVDLFVNKRGFAKGEMIVIGENFGVRVTDILSVPEIIEALR